MRELTLKVSYDDLDELVKGEMLENYRNCTSNDDLETAEHFKQCLFFYLTESEQMDFKG